MAPRLPNEWYWVDVALGVALAIIALNAGRRGFIREAGTLVGLVAGILLAGQLAGPVAGLWAQQSGRPPFAQELAYAVIVLVVVLAASAATGLLRSVAELPGLPILDSVAGVALGLVEGAAGLGLLLLSMTRFAAIGPWVPALEASTLAPFFLQCWLAVSAVLPPELGAPRTL